MAKTLEAADRHSIQEHIAVPSTYAAHWVLYPLNGAADCPRCGCAGCPATVVSWPQTSPYRLASGRVGVVSSGLSLGHVTPCLSECKLEAPASSRAGAAQQMIVEKNNDSGPRQQVSIRQQFWLRALLVAGVAAMAWHLLRQLKDGTSAPPPP